MIPSTPVRSLRAKILLGFGAVLVLLLVLSLVAWQSIDVLATDLQSLSANNLDGAVQLANTQNALWELRYSTPQFILGNAGAQKKILADQDKWYRQIEENLGAYERGARSAEERTALETWKAIYTPYKQDRPRFFELQGAGKVEEAKVWRAERMTPRGQATVQALETMIQLQRDVAATREQDARRRVVIANWVLAGTLGGAILLAAGIAIMLGRNITRPIHALTMAAHAVKNGTFETTLPVTTRDELGLLADAFNRMTATLAEQRAEIVAHQQTLAERNAELGRALDEARDAMMARDTLSTTLRHASVPVVPILKQVIALPLVGEIDHARAQTLMQQLLEGIVRQQARLAILDMTGVPFVDPTVVDWIVQAMEAAKLLGTRCTLVGLRPEVAQALVASGKQLPAVHTEADLRSAIAQVLEVRNNLDQFSRT